MLLGCIADDLTGATDLAINLAREGLSVVQVNGVPHNDIEVPDADAVVVALKSRTIPAAEAIAQSMMALAWLMLGRFALGSRRMSRSQLDHTLLLWIVPLALYLTNGKVKLELGLARGKEGVDKRQSIAERDARRQMERAVKERNSR